MRKPEFDLTELTDEECWELAERLHRRGVALGYLYGPTDDEPLLGIADTQRWLRTTLRPKHGEGISTLEPCLSADRSRSALKHHIYNVHIQQIVQVHRPTGLCRVSAPGGREYLAVIYQDPSGGRSMTVTRDEAAHVAAAYGVPDGGTTAQVAAALGCAVSDYGIDGRLAA